MPENEQEKQRLISASIIIVWARWFYIGAIGITGLITKILGGPNANYPVVVMVTMLFTCSLTNILVYIYFKKSKNTLIGIKAINILMLIFEIICYTIIVYFAGGIISVGFLYSIYPLISSAFLFNFWVVTFIATIESVLYGSLLFLEFLDIITYISRYNSEFESQIAHNKVAVIANTIAVITSFYIIGFFAGMLARNLRGKEKEIIAERDKEKAILADLSDGLIYINSENKIEMVNTKTEKMLEVKKEDILGKKINELGLKKYKLLNEVFKKNLQVFDYNFPFLDKYFRVFTVEIKNNKGQVIGTAKIIHDMSREKYVDKMKSEFITIAGHQLRTPLSAIKGALSLFLSGDYGEINKEQKTMIQQSYDYTEKLIKMVNDMLNVSSAEEGKYDYQFKETDLKQFVESNIGRFKEEAADHSVDFTFKIDENISVVEIDQAKFKLILNALIENSIVYNKENGKSNLTIRLKDDKVILEVSDTGIGIPREMEEKVFTKFFRAENALKHFTEGNGLDLYVVKNIVENHQGDIWFSSIPDVGTTFFVTIPLKQTKKGVIENL